MDIETTDREFMGLQPVKAPVEKDWRDENYWHALRWVNERRVRVLGLEPLDELPQGERHTGKRCPIGKATGIPFYGDAPAEVREFACCFDLGLYPALTEKP